MRHALPFASAVLLWLSFPPVDFGFLGWVALAPLVAYALIAKGRRAFFVAWGAGFLFHGVSFWWLWYTAPWIGPIGVGLYKGLYWGVFVLLARWACTPFDSAQGRGERARIPIALAAPVLWTALEFARSYFLGGLGFWVAGYTQHGLTAFVQIADLGGVWLVTFIVVLVNATIARAWVTGRRDAQHWWGAGASLAALAFAVIYGTVRLGTIELEDGMKVGIVQPNIPQDVKELYKERGQDRDAIYEKHLALSHEVAREKPDLIVWPEAAIVDYLVWQDGRWYENLWFDRAREPAVKTGIPHVIGLLVGEPPDRPEWRMNRETWRWTNSALYFDAAGRPVGRFDKIRLVPFSERMLFGNILPVGEIVAWFLETKVYEFSPGREMPVFDHPRGRFAVSICSENYYPEISREFARKGARVMINISNDGWFWESAELDAMLVMAKFRAIEGRVAYVRATNTGISAVFDPTGGATVLAGPDGRRKCVAGTLAAVVRTTRSGSPYRTLGDWAAWLCAGLCVGGVLATILARRRARAPGPSHEQAR